MKTKLSFLFFCLSAFSIAEASTATKQCTYHFFKPERKVYDVAYQKYKSILIKKGYVEADCSAKYSLWIEDLIEYTDELVGIDDSPWIGITVGFYKNKYRSSDPQGLGFYDRGSVLEEEYTTRTKRSVMRAVRKNLEKVMDCEELLKTGGSYDGIDWHDRACKNESSEISRGDR